MKNKTTKSRRRRANPLFVLGMGIALMLAGSWSYQLINMDRSIENQKTQLVIKKEEIVAQNNELRQEIEKLNTPSYVEQLAREKLGLVRKGEIMVAPKEATN